VLNGQLSENNIISPKSFSRWENGKYNLAQQRFLLRPITIILYQNILIQFRDPAPIIQ
jgi:hypothetical protein